MKTLNKLRDEIHEYAINKGFWDQTQRDRNAFDAMRVRIGRSDGS